jgi:hypothetical protein
VGGTPGQKLSGIWRFRLSWTEKRPQTDVDRSVAFFASGYLGIGFHPPLILLRF